MSCRPQRRRAAGPGVGKPARRPVGGWVLREARGGSHPVAKTALKQEGDVGGSSRVALAEGAVAGCGP